MFWLSENGLEEFPPVEASDEDGLLAVGGDLSPERLLMAYRSGIFPWFRQQGLIYWYSPPLRMILFPAEVKVSRSMNQILRSKRYSVTMNQAFEQVITSCAETHRLKSGGTWIDERFIAAYRSMFELGYAHSTEVWNGDQLCGGIYGIVLGSMFCGESMFSRESNTSKLALIQLCRSGNYSCIDCQVPTAHLQSLGARIVKREEYLQILSQALTGHVTF